MLSRSGRICPASRALFLRLPLVVCLLTAAFALTLPVHAASDSDPIVYRLVIRDTIQPVTAGLLTRAIELADRDHAAALLVELDTPGGLLESTRQMVGAMLSSRVPVIVYIAPAGARAGSAGFFLLEAADIAAMAPGTNAGAAHPVLSSGTPDDTMKQKMENDAAAFLRSYTSKRGRDADAAEQAVRSSKSYSADEAIKLKLIDLIAADDRQLLQSLDGKTHTRFGDQDVFNTFNFKNARIVDIEPTIRERLLGTLANPNLALLLLVVGGLLIYVEFNTPGTIVPGALGTVMVLLAVFALDLLPIRHTAVMLLAAAAVLMFLEIKFTSHGALGIAAIACLVLGTLTLVAAPIPELGIQPAVAIGLSLGFGLITLFLARLALRARRSKFLLGPQALVGSPAVAMEPVGPAGAPLGHILVQGEIWQAVSREPVAAHTRVRIAAFNGQVFTVEATSIPAPAPQFEG